MSLPPALKSISHPLARQAKLLAKGSQHRRESGLFLVEGPRGLDEALEARAEMVWVLVSPSLAESASVAPLIARVLAAGVPVQPVQQKLIERLTPSKHGLGLLAACRLPRDAADAQRVLGSRREGVVLVTWCVQDPGNLGTLIRSVAAFGARGLLTVEGSDPWNPKAVRASAGAIHRVPVARITDGEVLLDQLEQSGFRLLAALTEGGDCPSRTEFGTRDALILGAEVAGLPATVEARAKGLTIPISSQVESLSVATAGAILLDYARRKN